MFPKRMEFWNRIVFQKMLEKYAVSEEENQLMVEIDSVIADVDGDSHDTYGDDDDDDDSKEDTDEDDDKRHSRKGKWKKGTKGGRKHFKKMRRNNKKKTMRQRMRLAKKLRGLKCRN